MFVIISENRVFKSKSNNNRIKSSSLKLNIEI